MNYLAAMAQSQTVRQSASDAGVPRNTSFRWRLASWNGLPKIAPLLLMALPKRMKPIYLSRKKAVATLIAGLVSGAAAPLNEESLVNKSVSLLRVIVLGKQ